MALLLIAEDDRDMQKIILDYMERHGHTCLTASDGLEAANLLNNHPVDLGILDIMMPHMDGYSVCRIAREKNNLPIIFLTAKGGEEDKLRGYDCGADDYITKPFSLRVLLAKVNALLRRSMTGDQGSCLRGGGIRLIPSERKVMVDEKEIDLTYKEFELLLFFMQNKGQVFSREQLLNRIWGYDFEGSSRTIDTHMKTLRKKLGSEGKHLVTLIRSGYKFEE